MKKNEPVPAVSEEAVATALNERYRQVMSTANALRLQMLGLGFTLVQAERALARLGVLKRGRLDAGESLGSWLADRCPDIPYKTAMDWKALAERALRKIGGDECGALRLMTCADPGPAAAGDGEWTESQLKAREEIYACRTRGELRQILMPFLQHSGRPAGGRAAGAAPDANDPAACARAEWSRVIVPATNTVVLEAAARLLCRRDVEDALAALGVLVDYLHGREAELKKERRS